MIPPICTTIDNFVNSKISILDAWQNSSISGTGKCKGRGWSHSATPKDGNTETIDNPEWVDVPVSGKIPVNVFIGEFKSRKDVGWVLFVKVDVAGEIWYRSYELTNAAPQPIAWSNRKLPE